VDPIICTSSVLPGDPDAAWGITLKTRALECRRDSSWGKCTPPAGEGKELFCDSTCDSALSVFEIAPGRGTA
jgi:hypothetical protein